MAVKNVNMFEQHVEKIVIAVAAAGALFMGWMAIQPITIPAPAGITNAEGGDQLAPNDIEKTITSQLDTLEKQQNSLPVPDPKIPNYPGRYKQLAETDPLGSDVTSSAVAMFGPKNLQPRIVSGGGDNPNIELATPAPVAPEYLHAEARQDQVAAVLIDAAHPIPPGQQAVTRTQNSVVIDGYVPVGKMLLEMLQDKYKDVAAQQGIQRASIYRISVERQEQTPNGWSDWKPVPSTKAEPAPTDINFGAMKDGDLPANLDIVDNEFKQIVIPDFYQDAQGVAIPAPIQGRPVPGKIVDETKELQEQIDALKVSTGFRAVTPPPATPAAPGAATSTGPAPVLLPTDLATLKALPVLPFTFWDDTVLPNRTYRYRVEIQIVNPTYGWKWGLKNPKMKTEPFLSTGKIVTPPVTVLSDIAFFIRPNIDPPNLVSGRIYKQLNGKWYMGEFSTQPGQNISASITLFNETGNPRKDVDTGFTLVDAVVDKDKGAKVILKDPAGNLISRDADFSNPDNAKLFEESQKLTPMGAATTTAPGPTPPPPPRPVNRVPPPPPPPATVPATHPTTNRVRVTQ